jgi:hypothetical protein
MAWKNFVGPLAIRPRGKVGTTALVYGLSLAVRFISAAGVETEIPPQAAQGTNAMTSVVISDGGQICWRNWPSRPAQPLSFRNGALGSRGCRAACENTVALPLMSNCSAP